ncbi:hypothetical protein QR685DRAFT_595647 [Neurospora intermedia]|uniref:Uncharacterized protein n=1 Tax=Neurospora intermedia TaxID=5142 RepID=A0ABR3DN07_NEUIN
MANRNFEFPSPKSFSSRTDANKSDPEEGSNGVYIIDERRLPIPTNNSPESQQPSTSAEILPNVEVSHHSGHRESNVSPLEGMDDTTVDTIVDTIEGDPNEIRSKSLEPTIDEYHIYSTPPTQRSRELTVEDNKNASTLPHVASSPLPSPIQPHNPSPSPYLLLAELPYLSPTPASSATASSTPPASSRVNFSPLSPSASSPYTSISQGDSDQEGWDDEMFSL